LSKGRQEAKYSELSKKVTALQKEILENGGGVEDLKELHRLQTMNWYMYFETFHNFNRGNQE
jgi:hypothetical protein